VPDFVGHMLVDEDNPDVLARREALKGSLYVGRFGFGIHHEKVFLGVWRRRDMLLDRPFISEPAEEELLREENTAPRCQQAGDR